MKVFDGRQLTAARALAGLTLRELAQAAKVTKGTVNRIELAGMVHLAAKQRHGHVAQATWDKIADVLAQHGVELTTEGAGHGAGVRWSAPRDRRESKTAPRRWA
jgi:transcriptional regulator with XRE-family HTH domain